MIIREINLKILEPAVKHWDYCFRSPMFNKEKNVYNLNYIFVVTISETFIIFKCLRYQPNLMTVLR